MWSGVVLLIDLLCVERLLRRRKTVELCVVGVERLLRRRKKAWNCVMRLCELLLLTRHTLTQPRRGYGRPSKGR